MSTSDGLTVKLHQGRTILDIASTYPSLLRVILEVVQNSIDSGAKRIDVSISMLKRQFMVLDNGSGCGREKFQNALHSLNATMKAVDKYGQFGKGLVASLSVAEEFEFTSCPAPLRSQYTAYTFNKRTIGQQKEVVIPWAEITKLEFNPDGDVWWRTRIVAKGLTKDRHLTILTVKSLADDIGLKFSEAILARSITITVSLTDMQSKEQSQVVAVSQFSGKKLPVVEERYPDAGNIRIEPYVAPMGNKGRRGAMVLGTFNNPSRISMEDFLRSASGFMESDIRRALNSGVFEGQILCESVTLHSDRTRFEENDALVELCAVIEKWYQDYGSSVIEEVRDLDKDKRFVRIGDSIMPFAELLMQQAEYRQLMGNIKVDPTADENAGTDSEDVVGPEGDGPVAVSNNNGGNGGGGGGGGGTSGTSREHPDKPVGGTRRGGGTRARVKGTSTGLSFAYVEMQDITIPFTYNASTGLLSFNIDNPNWSMCAEYDHTLAEYQMDVVLAAFLLELHRAESNGHPNPAVVENTFRFLSQRVFGILNGRPMMRKLVFTK